MTELVTYIMRGRMIADRTLRALNPRDRALRDRLSHAAGRPGLRAPPLRPGRGV